MLRRLFNRLLRRHARNYSCNQTASVSLSVSASDGSKCVAHVATQQDECRQELDVDQGQIINVIGYRRVRWKSWLSYFFMVLSLGVLRLIFHWFPKFWVRCTHREESLKCCERLLIEDDYKGKWKTYTTVLVQRLELSNKRKLCYFKENSLKETNTVITFTYKSIRYILENKRFERLQGLGDGIPQNVLHSNAGLTEEENTSRKIVYGSNEIQVPLTPIFQLILLEILMPFYIFQIFAVILWIIEVYIYYVIVIMILTILGICGHVYETRKNQRQLRSSVRVKEQILVYRPLSGSSMTQSETTVIPICSTELVPGDVVSLKEGYVYCDAILLNGTCLVDESMLTGESIQVLKTPIPNNPNLYHHEDSTPHTLFAGTRIVQANGELRALVTRTGFLTSKGSLIRSIMYPPPMDYAFDRDCTKYCIIMFVIGASYAVYVAYSKAQRGIPLFDLIIKTLDSVTILLPAALPATITIGKLRALKNLQKKQIFCTNSKVLTVSGSVDVICLDKTGTITEDQLDFIGVVPFGHIKILKNTDQFSKDISLGMSTCHNLALYQGQIHGDHLEVQMFRAVGSQILGSDHKIQLSAKQEVNLLERYQFSSNLRRMSVVVETNGQYIVFCKGSPETIAPLCNNHEKINLEQLDILTKKGYRVLSLGTKTLTSFSEAMSREEVESDLTFLGYLVFENKLKPGSAEVIKELQRGNLIIKMITGDNVETAIQVAKETGILPYGSQPRVLTTLDQYGHNIWGQFQTLVRSSETLAVTGTAWQQLLTRDEAFAKEVVGKIQVFARMASSQKQQVIETLQEMKFSVCMCGDGANDCSALKAANVGISLTESESSMASHLTSGVQNISAVLDTVREGRSALVTIVQIVKINLSGNLIQYIGLLLLYEIDASFADLQFLYLDLHLLLYGFFVGYVDAYTGPLSPNPPTQTLLSLKPNISILGQLIPAVSFQFLGMWMLKSQDWFVPYIHDPEMGNDFLCYENYMVFILALFQYASLAVIFSKGSPYRKPMWTNWTLCLCLIGYLFIDLWLALGDVEWLLAFFEIKIPPDDGFRWKVVALGLAHLVTAIVIEDVIVEKFIGDWFLDRKDTARKKDEMQV